MLSTYPACFFKEDDGYSVIFPDLNYLATCGDTLDEAFSMAIDCLASYLYWLQKDGQTAPTPSAMDAVSTEDLAHELEVSPDGAFVNMVTVDVAEYLSKRLLLFQPGSTPQRLNRISTSPRYCRTL